MVSKFSVDLTDLTRLRVREVYANPTKIDQSLQEKI